MIEKKLFVTLLFTVLCSRMFAQHFAIGVHQGFGVAQLSNFHETRNDAFGADWVKAPLAGVNINYYPWKRFGLHMEINYSRKGNNRYGLSSRYHYMHVPIMASFDFYKNKSGTFKSFVKAGVYGAFLNDQSQRGTSGPIQVYLTEFGSVNDVDFGLNFGAGTRVALDKQISLSMELRTERGLGSVYPLILADSNAEKAKNISNWLVIGLCYTFESPYTPD